MPEITRGPTSGKLEKAKRRARMARNVQPDGPAGVSQTDSHLDRLPKRWDGESKNDTDRTAQEIRDLQDIIKEGSLVGEDKLLGQRHWDEGLYNRIKAMKDAEMERRQKNMLEQIVYDPSDPYQRAKLDALMPDFKSSREKVADDQIEQFSFLTKMGMKPEFSSADECHRIMMILGGAEKLICLNHVIQTVAGSSKNGMYALLQTKDRFPLSYQDDEWAKEALSPGTDVQEILVELAKTVLHLFPVLLAGKFAPMSLASQDAASRHKRGQSADALQKYAAEYCRDISPGVYAVDATRTLTRTRNTPLGLAGYLPPSFTSGYST